MDPWVTTVIAGKISFLVDVGASLSVLMPFRRPLLPSTVSDAGMNSITETLPSKSSPLLLPRNLLFHTFISSYLTLPIPSYRMRHPVPYRTYLHISLLPTQPSLILSVAQIINTLVSSPINKYPHPALSKPNTLNPRPISWSGTLKISLLPTAINP